MHKIRTLTMIVFFYVLFINLFFFLFSMALIEPFVVPLDKQLILLSVRWLIILFCPRSRWLGFVIKTLFRGLFELEATSSLGQLGMLPGGADSGASSPTSIHSVPQDDIWREVEKTEQACSSAPPAAREVGVGPSTGGKAADSGSGSESWRQFLNLSSASNEGRQPEGDGATSQQPQGEVDQPAANVMGAEAPDPMWLKNHIERGFLIIKGRKPQKRVLAQLFYDLQLETASPQKRLQIVKILDQMKMDDSLKGRDFRLDLELGNRIYDWEREQRHFPNPVDDVP